MTDPVDSVPIPAPPSPDLSALAMKAQVAAAIFGEDATPVKVGRYEVLETLGVGGMGVVYAAWDESLGRRVALKLLPADEVGSDRERARLAREAQALAKLSHPNVVTVFEAGEHDHGVFVAMELVEGVSLQKWQQQQVRTRKELVEVYLQAGQGLAAAHRAGLVHRDFKPANVLVGSDGRVRVVDFGLAQGPGLAAPTTSGTGRQLSSPPHSPVTRTGALVGTPAYMAPEQIAGAEADARADQFSFCVALYEALVGCRPYEVAVLRAAPERNVPPPTKGSRGLPLLLGRALRRGLAIEPQRRWPDMDALLRSIDVDAAWRRRLWGFSGPMVLGLVVAWLARGDEPQPDELEPAEPERTCEAPNDGPAKDWIHRRDQLSSAFEATDQRYRTQAWQLAEGKLGRHAAEWSEEFVATCRERDELERTRRFACLERQAVLFDAVLDELADVDSQSIANVDVVVDILAPAIECRDPTQESDDTSTEPRELLQGMSEAILRAASGRYPEALDQLTALLARLPADSPLRAEVLLRQGEVLTRLERNAEAEDALIAALTIAGSRERSTRAVLGEVELLGTMERVDELKPLLRLGEELARRLPRPSAVYADYLDAKGRVAPTPELAMALHQSALEERSTLGRTRSDRDVIETKLLLANALADGGDPVKARASYEEARAALVGTLGEEHPEHAKILFGLGLLAQDEGDLDEAQRLLDRAASIEEAAYGESSVQLARTRVVQAMTATALEEPELGRVLAEQAFDAIEAAKLRPGHSDRIASLRALATIELDLGHHQRALELHHRLAAEAGTDDAPDVLHNIAWLQCQVGECKASRRLVDQALTQVDARLLHGSDPNAETLRLYILHTSALVALAEGDAEKARVLLAEVLRFAPKHSDYPGTPELIAEARKDMQRARRVR